MQVVVVPLYPSINPLSFSLAGKTHLFTTFAPRSLPGDLRHGRQRQRRPRNRRRQTHCDDDFRATHSSRNLISERAGLQSLATAAGERAARSVPPPLLSLSRVAAFLIRDLWVFLCLCVQSSLALTDQLSCIEVHSLLLFFLGTHKFLEMLLSRPPEAGVWSLSLFYFRLYSR